MQTAVALVLFTVSATAEHSVVPPCMNVTVPVGTTEPDDAVTVAVRVAVWFTSGDVGMDVSVVTATPEPLFTVS